ncbi:MAG: hypothetical protein WAL87_08145 [Chthoniobacterales bacterium]
MTYLSLVLLMLTLLLPACVSSQGGAGSSGSGTDSPASLAVLLGLDGVRQELQITPVQSGLLDALQSDYKSQAKNIMAIGQADQDAALRADWDIRSLRKQYNARSLAVLTPDQQQRLMELQRQMLGGSLLSSVTEQKLLGLSTQQQQQLAALSSSSQAQATSINAQAQAGQLSDFRKGIELRRLQQQTSDRMVAVLTPDQKKQWKILSGQKSGMPEIHDPNARTQSLFEGY